MRRVLVHLHLFKNAGTSIDRSLQQNYGPAWTTHDRPKDGRVLTGDELRTFVEGRPELRAVSSHLLRPPLDRIDQTEQPASEIAFDPIVLLRHPLDRIRSAFEFEARRKTEQPTGSLAEWIEWNRSRNSKQCSNFQVFALTTLRRPDGHVDYAHGDDEHRDAAEQFVANLPAFGLVEQFDESRQWLTAQLGRHHPDLDLSDRHENRRRFRPRKLDDRLDRMRRALGDADYSQLVDDNALDSALWQWASDRFQQLAR